MTTDDAYTRAIRYARQQGAEDGAAAASWVDVDDTNAAAILQGMEDGDPEMLDRLPSPDLSGQWAGSLTGPDLVRDALVDAGIDDDGPESMDWFSDICDAYDEGFAEAVESVVGTRCRFYLEA